MPRNAMTAGRFYRVDANTCRWLDRMIAEDRIKEAELYRRLVRAEAERRGYLTAHPPAESEPIVLKD